MPHFRAKVIKMRFAGSNSHVIYTRRLQWRTKKIFVWGVHSVAYGGHFFVV